MKNPNVTKLNALKRQKRIVRLFTKHFDGDGYDGIVLAAHPNLVFLKNVDEFQLNGVVALQNRFIKSIRLGPLEKMIDKIIAQNGQINKLKRISWLEKVESVQQLIKHCYHKKIWPMVEVKFKKICALYIGPITHLGENDFEMYCYDAKGKWEKKYKLAYKKVINVQIFDNYSKWFNRYMRQQKGWRS